MFQDKRNLLDLYNAINGTNHQDPEELEITTLHMLLTEFDEKKFAKSMWEEGHESGYLECRDSILKIMDEINNGNDTVEKLVALGYDATLAQKVLEKK